MRRLRARILSNPHLGKGYCTVHWSPSSGPPRTSAIDGGFRRLGKARDRPDRWSDLNTGKSSGLLTTAGGRAFFWQD